MMKSKRFDKFPQIRPSYPVAILVATLVLTLTACSDGPAWKKNEFKSTEKANTAGVVEIPKGLWEKIENGESKPGGEHPADGETKPETKANSKSGLPTEFAPLTIYLVEKNKGILKKGHTKISFSAGGGDIDLTEFVSDLNGSFRFVAEFLPEVEGLKRRVFFLSNSPVRVLDREGWGGGCHNYFEISSAIEDARKKDGILANTTDGRHVSALAGTYIFSAVHDHKLKLASLVVRDSKHKNLLCRH